MSQLALLSFELIDISTHILLACICPNCSRTVYQHDKVADNADYSNSPAPCNVYVPNHVVARLIGKGGKCISDLQAQFGARIQIQRESEMKRGQTDRLVSLFGSTDAVTLCRAMIDRMVAKWKCAGDDGLQRKQQAQKLPQHLPQHLPQYGTYNSIPAPGYAFTGSSAQSLDYFPCYYPNAR